MKSNNGFTLLELMITVAIIAILMAIGLTNFSYQIKWSKDSKALEMMSVMREHVSLIQSDLGGYAPNSDEIIMVMTSEGTYNCQQTGETTILKKVTGFAKAHTDYYGSNQKLRTGTPTTGVDWIYSVDSANENWHLSFNTTSKNTKDKSWNLY